MANVTSLMSQGRQLGTIRPARSNVLINTQSGPLSFSMINTRGLITKTVKSAEGIKTARQWGPFCCRGYRSRGHPCRAEVASLGQTRGRNVQMSNLLKSDQKPQKRWFILITDEAANKRRQQVKIRCYSLRRRGALIPAHRGSAPLTKTLAAVNVQPES